MSAVLTWLIASLPRAPKEAELRVINSIEDAKALVGQEVGLSDWIVIDQHRIDQFAEATADHQWIHVDIERAAKEMPDGKTIAHGYLTLGTDTGTHR